MARKVAMGLAVLWLLAGCEQGACYYTCCPDPTGESCEPSCLDQSTSTEKCAVAAQESCDAEGETLGRTEWAEISDLLCDGCSSIACAPDWWTEERLKSEAESTDSLEPDGGE
jgi:hypothetical protein